MTIYGYARVSSAGQDLEVQLLELEARGATEIFREKHTGSKVDRPEFNKVISKLEKNDTLMVTKLDRFARNTKEALEIVESLLKKKVNIHILDLGLIDNTPTGELIYTVFLAFANFERRLIVERTQAGKAIAKQNPDFKEGRPKKFTKKQVAHALQLLECNSYTQVEEITGISRSTLTRAKREAAKEEK